MARTLLALRRSTLSLYGVGLSLGVLAFLGGRSALSKGFVAGSDAGPRARPPQVAAVARAAGADAGERQATVPATGNFAQVWRRWLAGPRTADLVQEIKDALEKLARDDPNGAMALALGENDAGLRDGLRNAVLRGWASESPEAAADWVMALPEGEHHPAMEAVFAGAARHPEEAMDLGRRLCAQDPTLAGDYGQLLITALTEAGAYETAARFAAMDTSENLPAWLNVAFFKWATQQPEPALRAFEEMADSEGRDAAFQGLMAGWAEANPAALATYVMHLAPGEVRAQALGQTLTQWVSRDPVAASEWLVVHYDPTSDLDEGAAAAATLPNLISQRPEIATAWAEAITDPVLRVDTLRMVAQEWAQRDHEAIRRFIASTPGLSEEEHIALDKGLNAPPDT
jgi:hypothetical protein